MKYTMASVGWRSTDPFDLMDSIPVTHPNQIERHHVLLLHGGEDISPSIYNQEPNEFCFAPRKPSRRDTLEIACVEQAVKMGLPIVGICRGAQLICALDGGSLCQHIVGHSQNGGQHHLYDPVTKEILCKSNTAHHQMMIPKPGNVILAQTQEKFRGFGENEEVTEYTTCPEIVWFPEMRAIGIQGHPEWLPKSKFTQLCGEFITKYLLKD